MEGYFIFVGRLDKLKGVDVLLEAWNRMGVQAPKLLICGTGPMESWCRGYIDENNLTTVEMMGFVPNTESRELIANSRALILPTQWYEGFPMTIVEAYSVGIPVVGSDMGNVGSLIENGVTGWKFNAQSPEMLMKMVKNTEMGQFCAEEIIRIYQKYYSMEENYKELLEIYNNCT